MASYRFYYLAARAPGTLKPEVRAVDAGPNVCRIAQHRTMIAARLHAWWLNRRLA